MRDEYDKMITTTGVYSVSQNVRPYMARMKKIFGNQEQSISFSDDSFDMVKATVRLEIFLFAYKLFKLTEIDWYLI